MKRGLRAFVALALLFAIAAPLMQLKRTFADNLLTEPLTGTTLNGSWISGGSPSACLTASSATTGDIPGCSLGTPDLSGSGALRLTSNANNQAGFVINQTPISTANGLQISFDMYQYDGSGADGIAFSLINGADSPTQPGAFGGALGYASSGASPGLAGGYVGVGFDVYGNFSNSDVGGGGPGPSANTIAVRGAGSGTTGYPFVTSKVASYPLNDDSTSSRTAAMRQVTISISNNNIMNVYVNYENGHGPIEELSNINLNTINGAGSLPASLKFGFTASTGGSNDIHEISNVSVDTLTPNVSATASQGGTLTQGQLGQYTLAVKNDAGAEPTTGAITVNDTLPSGIAPVSASGNGWTCSVSGQTVSCTRPGGGANALAPGDSEPDITVSVGVNNNAAATLTNTATVATTDNDSLNTGTTNTFTVTPAVTTIGSGSQDASSTSLTNDITGNYATLATSGDCDQNENVSVDSVTANDTQDGNYTYPVGMMGFNLICTAPGGTATITQYYYGDYDASQFVARKYNPNTHVYSAIPGATLSSVTIGGQSALKLTYAVTDGSSLDEDGVANGVIVDPAGPAIADTSPSSGSTGAGATLTDTGIDVSAITLFSALLIAGTVVVRTARTER